MRTNYPPLLRYSFNYIGAVEGAEGWEVSADCVAKRECCGGRVTHENVVSLNKLIKVELLALRRSEFYRKIHYLTREFCVKLHAKTDIARIAKR